MDPHFTSIDILSCRNLLIYLTPQLQQKLLALFHYSINPGGVLFLGSAETIGSFTDLFEPLKGKTRLYRRLESTLHKELFELPSAGFPVPPGAPDPVIIQLKAQKHASNLEDLANQLILQHYSPAAVLVSDRGDILYTRGRTGKYLEPAAGKANWNIGAMVHKDLRYKLSSSLQKAVRQNSTVIMENVKIDTGGGKQTVDVTVHPFTEQEALQRLFMIVFTNARMLSETKVLGWLGRTLDHRNRVAELELELEQSRQELHVDIKMA